MKSIGSKILIIISMIIVVILLVCLNMLSYKEKLNSKTPNKITTTTNVSDSYLKDDSLFINDYEEIISVKEYKDHYLGLEFNFEYNKFVINKLSNSAIIILNNIDKNEYLKIEKLDEMEYYQNYEKYNDVETIEDEYIVNYKFLTGNSYFLKLTKRYNNTKDTIHRFDYIISTLYFN